MRRFHDRNGNLTYRFKSCTEHRDNEFRVSVSSFLNSIIYIAEKGNSAPKDHLKASSSWKLLELKFKVASDPIPVTTLQSPSLG